MLNRNRILFMRNQKFSTSHRKNCHEKLQLKKILILLISKKFKKWLSIKVYVVNEIIIIQNLNYFKHELGIIEIQFYRRCVSGTTMLSILSERAWVLLHKNKPSVGMRAITAPSFCAYSRTPLQNSVTAPHVSLLHVNDITTKIKVALKLSDESRQKRIEAPDRFLIFHTAVKWSAIFTDDLDGVHNCAPYGPASPPPKAFLSILLSWCAYTSAFCTYRLLHHPPRGFPACNRSQINLSTNLFAESRIVPLS